VRRRVVQVMVSTVVMAGCGRADLVVESGAPKVDLARTGVPGGSLRLGAWTVRNRGTRKTRAAGGPILNTYHLSPDGVITPDDRVLKGLAEPDLPDLGAGQSHTFPGDEQIGIPEDVQPGTYYFGILLDRTDQVEEADEENNSVAARIGIVRPE
jgi:hypothetical protein